MANFSILVVLSQNLSRCFSESLFAADAACTTSGAQLIHALAFLSQLTAAAIHFFAGWRCV